MPQRPMHKVSPDALRDFMERMLLALGCDEETSKIAAEIHLEADLRGILYQGTGIRTCFPAVYTKG